MITILQGDCIEVMKTLSAETNANHVTSEVQNALQNRFDVIHNLYVSDVGRLQQPGTASSGSALRQAPGAAIGNHAKTCRAGLPAESKRRILELMELAQIQTEQLKACQDWIRGQEDVFNH